MSTLFSDVKDLIQKHWKSILAIALTIYLFNVYPDIKQGLMDGWLDR